jgi:hypothetical protein
MILLGFSLQKPIGVPIDKNKMKKGKNISFALGFNLSRGILMNLLRIFLEFSVG